MCGLDEGRGFQCVYCIVADFLRGPNSTVFVDQQPAAKNKIITIVQCIKDVLAHVSNNKTHKN